MPPSLLPLEFDGFTEGRGHLTAILVEMVEPKAGLSTHVAVLEGTPATLDPVTIRSLQLNL